MKLICYWIYDFRTKTKKNMWQYILERHESCKSELKEITQGNTKKLVRRFLCFNCLNTLCYTYIKQMSKEDFKKLDLKENEWFQRWKIEK